METRVKKWRREITTNGHMQFFQRLVQGAKSVAVQFRTIAADAAGIIGSQQRHAGPNERQANIPDGPRMALLAVSRFGVADESADSTMFVSARDKVGLLTRHVSVPFHFDRLNKP